MAEKEYIEREAAKNILLQHQHRFTCADEANGYGSVKWSEDVIYLSEAVNGIAAIPAADVRPVVLCKDCKHRFMTPNGWHCPYAEWGIEDDDFCCCGEKREES